GATSADASVRLAIGQGNGRPSIEYLAEFTDKERLIALYKSCDALVSAHRGEGFGMKILDALACGLPVITPLFGGVTTYCTADNCFPVAFSHVAMRACLDTQSLHITNTPMWAEVDLASLRDQMRRVRSDQKGALEVAARGRQSVEDRFSWANAARRLND